MQLAAFSVAVCVLLAAAAQAQTLVRSGPFTLVYNTSALDRTAWYINDHTLM